MKEKGPIVLELITKVFVEQPRLHPVIKKKPEKSKSWFRGGGHQVPLFVPHSPGSELAKFMRRKEEENTQGRRIRFLIVELGGKNTQSHLIFSSTE